MPEPKPPDDMSALGQTRIVSEPITHPPSEHSTAAHGGTFAFGGAPSSAFPLPTHIGRFEVRTCLGAGAFGWVYLAFDPTLRREVAIKLPRPERLQTVADRTRFLNEARAAATIRHPHVVPVHEVGEMEGTPFIVMGYVSGPTLAAVLRERKAPFPPHEAAKIIAALALAVQAAHDKGVVHRDLKPANVLFDPEQGEYLITDFGLARLVDPGDPRTTTTGAAGTPAYMPPEQARGDSAAIGPRSDVYALGVMLFELLTRQLPFSGDSVAEIIAHVLMTPPPLASSLRAGVPAKIDSICRRAMAKQPDDRYSSAEEFANALSTFADKAPTTSRRAVLAAGAVAVAGIAGGVVYFSRKPETAKREPNPEPDQPKPPQPKPKPKTNLAAERRAAEWTLRSGGNLEVIDTKTGGKLKPAKIADLPADFRVTFVEVPSHDNPTASREVVTDEAIRANLVGTSDLQSLNFPASPNLTNAGVAELARLPALRSLGIRYCAKVTDDGVKAFARHPTLREIYFIGTGMSPAGVGYLATIPHLDYLSFHGHAITDEWLAAAARALGLQQLYCGYSFDHKGAGITDGGFAHLSKLKALYLLDLDSAAVEMGALKGLPEMSAMNQLFLRRTDADDDDITAVVKYSNLFALGLHDTRVTDKGMPTVAKLTALRRLYLEGTRVTDDGLKVLTACKDLRQVYIANTTISAAAVREFKKSVPECEFIPMPKE